jgi:hypothetical protein
METIQLTTTRDFFKAVDLLTAANVRFTQDLLTLAIQTCDEIAFEILGGIIYFRE